MISEIGLNLVTEDSVTRVCQKEKPSKILLPKYSLEFEPGCPPMCHLLNTCLPLLISLSMLCIVPPGHRGPLHLYVMAHFCIILVFGEGFSHGVICIAFLNCPQCCCWRSGGNSLSTKIVIQLFDSEATPDVGNFRY